MLLCMDRDEQYTTYLLSTIYILAHSSDDVCENSAVPQSTPAGPSLGRSHPRAPSRALNHCLRSRVTFVLHFFDCWLRYWSSHTAPISVKAMMALAHGGLQRRHRTPSGGQTLQTAAMNEDQRSRQYPSHQSLPGTQRP